MKTRTFRHKNSKTRKSKKGGISDAARAAAFAYRNPETTKNMVKYGTKVNKLLTNSNKQFTNLVNSNQAQEAMNKMSTARANFQGNVNKAMNSEQARKAKEELIKKKSKFSNVASNFMKQGMNKGGRKWSLKYKRSINCKRPKGFSQKQHCKYGRRKSRRTRKSRK